MGAGGRARKGELQHTRVTIGAAAVKTLNASPVTIVEGCGVDSYIEFVSATLELRAGTEVFTETADNLAFCYTDASGTQLSNTIECTNFIDQSVDTITFVGPNSTEPIVAHSTADDAPLVLANLNDEFAGNASNDAQLSVEVAYRVHNFW